MPQETASKLTARRLPSGRARQLSALRQIKEAVAGVRLLVPVPRQRLAAERLAQAVVDSAFAQVDKEFPPRPEIWPDIAKLVSLVARTAGLAVKEVVRHLVGGVSALL